MHNTIIINYLRHFSITLLVKYWLAVFIKSFIIFKVVILVIIKDLAKIARYYFINKIILKNLKKSITVVLYKEGKNYFFLNSYKLITLKNTLVKVLEASGNC